MRDGPLSNRISEAFVIAMFIVVFVVAYSAWFVYMGRVSTVPRCQEDAVLVGIGDYKGGRWTAYQCGPAVDDFAQ